MSSERFWRRIGRLLIERWWDGEVLIYDDYSGATHFLEGTAALIWRELTQNSRMTAAELDRCLPTTPSEAMPERRVALVTDTLVELARLEIVEESLD